MSGLIFTLVGLGCDVVGVILLAWALFQKPQYAMILTDGEVVVVHRNSSNSSHGFEIEAHTAMQNARRRLIGWGGLGLAVFGFALQDVGAWFATVPQYV